jgi:hypothetical protein
LFFKLDSKIKVLGSGAGAILRNEPKMPGPDYLDSTAITDGFFSAEFGTRQIDIHQTVGAGAN